MLKTSNHKTENAGGYIPKNKKKCDNALCDIIIKTPGKLCISCYKNSQCDTCWIYNEEESIRIKNTELDNYLING